MSFVDEFEKNTLSELIRDHGLYDQFTENGSQVLSALTVEMVRVLDASDILDLFDSAKDRVLFTVMQKTTSIRHVIGHERPPAPRKRDEHRFKIQKNAVEEWIDQGMSDVLRGPTRFDGRGRYHTACIPSIQRLSETLSISDLATYMRKFACTLPIHHVKTIDFSACGLTGFDLTHIFNIVDDIAGISDGLFTVKLNDNRVYGVSREERYQIDYCILAFLRSKRIQYVDVTGNAMVSVELIDFFKRLGEEELSCLIFLREDEVHAEDWAGMVQHADIVRRTHTSYYEH